MLIHAVYPVSEPRRFPVYHRHIFTHSGEVLGSHCSATHQSLNEDDRDILLARGGREYDLFQQPLSTEFVLALVGV